MPKEDVFAGRRRNERLAFMRASPVSATVEIPAARGVFLGVALRSPAPAAAAALLLRLGFLWLAHQSANFFSVGQEAGNIAWALARGDGFSSPLIGMQGPTAWV